LLEVEMLIFFTLVGVMGPSLACLRIHGS
jgi:hypothetical protein